MKRTYNLPEPMVLDVRDAVETHAWAPSQDAFVRMAIEDLLMRCRHQREGEAFAAAIDDPELSGEGERLDREFWPLDRADWPAE